MRVTSLNPEDQLQRKSLKAIGIVSKTSKSGLVRFHARKWHLKRMKATSNTNHKGKVSQVIRTGINIRVNPTCEH